MDNSKSLYTVGEEIKDMTAQEWFEKGSMFTLDFLQPAEKETIFKIMDMYALGKTRVASKEIGELKKEWFDAGLATNKMMLDDFSEQISNMSKCLPKDFHPDISLPASRIESQPSSINPSTEGVSEQDELAKDIKEMAKRYIVDMSVNQLEQELSIGCAFEKELSSKYLLIKK